MPRHPQTSAERLDMLRARRARLWNTTADHGVLAVASMAARQRRVSALDKVYSRLMLGKKATLDGERLLR